MGNGRLRINGRVTISMRSDKYDNDLNVPITIIYHNIHYAKSECDTQIEMSAFR